MKNWRINIVLFHLVCVFVLTGCIKDPQPAETSQGINYTAHGAFILCEGIWGMNNSSLSRYSLADNSVILDYFKTANQGFQLGDLANDIKIIGDTVYIAVSSSKTIETFSISTGKYLGNIKFNNKGAVRKLCIVSDTLAFVTRLLGNSISSFNPKTYEILKDEIPVGPAPEGICYHKGFIYVANSGFGDYLAKDPKAGKISVVDVKKQTEVNIIDAGPNVLEVLADSATGRLYASYTNLPSQVNKYDSLGGIVEYDLNSLKKIREWKARPKSLILSNNHTEIIFINNHDIARIRLTGQNSLPEVLIKNPDINDFWYSFAINPYDNTIWIGNAKNYQVRGQVLVYEVRGNPVILKSFSTGINPNAIIFF